MTNNNEWVRRTLWGACLTLGAALTLGSASFPNLGFLEDRHEFPVVELQDPVREGSAPA